MKRNYFMMASDSEDSCELQPATKKSVAPQNSFGTFNSGMALDLSLCCLVFDEKLFEKLSVLKIENNI